MKLRNGLFMMSAAFCLVASGPFRVTAAPPFKVQGPGLVKTVVVPANQDWTDTGLDVRRDEELIFKGKGEMTLQMGNPAAACGPDGMDILSSQQPIPDKKTGALIGKVVQLIGVRKDEKTGEEVRDEIVEMFYIGREGRISMPTSGRLYLGINENVVKDNDGEFKVDVFRPKDRQAA